MKQNRLNFEDFKKRALENPEVKKEYDALKETQDLRIELIKMRKEAGLTIEKVAECMHTSKSNISRLESPTYLSRHSPKLSTLHQFAKICGKHLKLEFVKE